MATFFIVFFHNFVSQWAVRNYAILNLSRQSHHGSPFLFTGRLSDQEWPLCSSHYAIKGCSPPQKSSTVGCKLWKLGCMGPRLRCTEVKSVPLQTLHYPSNIWNLPCQIFTHMTLGLLQTPTPKYNNAAQTTRRYKTYGRVPVPLVHRHQSFKMHSCHP